MGARSAPAARAADAAGVVAAGLSPHPPLIIPEVGGRELSRVASTVDGLTELVRRFLSTDLGTLIVLSPHGPVLRHSFVVYGQSEVGGDFGEFGAPEIRVRMTTDRPLVAAVKQAAGAAGLPVTDLAEVVGAGEMSGDRSAELHYAVLVPLDYFRRAGFGGQVVVINTPHTALAHCYRFGELLAGVAADSGRRIGILASGDLSHRLQPGAPAGYDRRGAEFDRRVMAAIGADDPDELLAFEPVFVDAAGECGLRPIVTMYGAARAAGLKPEVLSYEGPFGVGYGTAFFGRPPVVDETDAEVKSGEHPLVELARRTIEAYVREDRLIGPPDGEIAPGLPVAAGAFVSLHRNGRLRGCIGTIGPTRPRLAEEIIHNAIAAATEDPRFRPVSPAELDDLEISVDVLGAPESVTSLDQLDPKEYGVIVERRGRRGLLLPDLDGVDTVAEQIAIAAEKAGLDPRDPELRIMRFRVTRCH